MNFEEYVKDALDRGERKMDELSGKMDKHGEQMADIRVDVERKSATYGAISGLGSSVLAGLAMWFGGHKA